MNAPIDPDKVFYRLDVLLDIMERPPRKYRGDRTGPFRRVVPLAMDGLDFLGEDIPVYLDSGPSCLDGPLNVACVSNVDNGIDITLTRVRKASLSQVRGRIKRPMKEVYEMGILSISRHEAMASGWLQYFGGNNVDELCDLDRNTDQNRTHWGRVHSPDIVRMMVGLQFIQEYFWTVDLQRDRDGFSVRLLCCADGIKQLLRDRAIPPGLKKRAYIKNWVREHMRIGKSDQALVRQHLRGRQIIHCDDFACEIHAPQSEVREVLRKYGHESPPSVISENNEHKEALA